MSSPSTPASEAAPPGPESPAPAAPTIEARVAEFGNVTSGTPGEPLASLDRLLDVTVTVTAELGRVTLPISEILKFGIGSVLELNRTVSEPVDLVVQGVRLARGEVVVVDDRFAVRIKEVSDPKRRLEK